MANERRQRRRIRRDRRREQRKVRAGRHTHRILRFIVRTALLSFFSVEVHGRETISRASGPLLLLGNHSSVIDPLLVGINVNKPLQYVVSDSQFRSRLLSFILGLVGSIPKTKVMSDLDTVKKIVTVKNSGGYIGIFPEGQSSWDGHSLPVVRATDKLVKSLKIPVYVSRLEGAYLAWPRWARRPRRGRIRITFSQLFTREDLKSLSVKDVGDRMHDALEVDAFAFQRAHRFSYRGSRTAEYLERVLFVCPACFGMSTLRSDRRRVSCTECGYAVAFTTQGFFEQRCGPLRFDTIRAWNTWQLEWFTKYLDQRVRSTHAERDANGYESPILTESEVFVREGYKSQPLKPIGHAALMLSTDRMRITFDDGTTLEIPVNEIEGINVQNNEHLEFYTAWSLYRISPVDPRGNTFKWDFAVRRLQNGAPRSGAAV